jgi:hypothetical protein
VATGNEEDARLRGGRRREREREQQGATNQHLLIVYVCTASRKALCGADPPGVVNESGDTAC